MKVINVKNKIRSRPRGFTFVEMIVSLAIFMIFSLGVTVTTIYGLRVRQIDLAQMRMTQSARKIISHLETEVRISNQIIEKADGDKVHIRIPDTGSGSRTAALYFLDEDDDPITVGDNYLMYDSDVNDDEPATVLASRVSRLEERQVFSYPGATEPLRIAFRLGDNTKDPEAPSHAYTGPGFQTLSITHSLVPRN